jgi:hypothetical protein
VSDQHKWWDIWQEDDGDFDWRCQAINYVARFKTEEDAKKYVAATIKYRTDKGLKV